MIDYIIQQAKDLTYNDFESTHKQFIFNVEGSSNDFTITYVSGVYMIFISFINKRYNEYRVMIRDKHNRYIKQD